MKQRVPLVKHIFTADPSAHVFNGRIYVYPSHDLPHDGEDDDEGGEYLMEDYHVLSLDDPDAECIDHGEALHIRDVPWADKQMWAPDCAFKDGQYYLYFPAKDCRGIFRIGVAQSSSPTGPFTAEPSWIEDSKSIDPAVFMDDDGRCYLYNGGLWGGQLEKWQTGEYTDHPDPIPGDAPSLGPYVGELSGDMKSYKEKPVMIRILDSSGEPVKACDEERRFFEGSWMHKYNGTYYFSYSTGTTHYICYATGDNPYGPFTYRGRILEPVIGWTTQHSIIEFRGKWYIFYHDCEMSGGINHRRTVKFTELHYNPDGTIRTISPYEEPFRMETDRLVLRRWAESDAETLYRYACDPDVGPIAGWPPHQSVEESLDVIRNVLSAAQAYAICLKTEDKPIGAVELKLKGHTDMTDRDDECELGYWLGKPFWGQGIMPEAAGELIRYGFEDLGMNKIWCGYYDGNTKSKRVQEKCGFRYQWTTQDVDVPLMHEKRVGHVSCLTKEEWLASRGSQDT